MSPVNIELFSGIGGLALGLSRAGFRHAVLVECDRHMVATVAHNRQRKIEYVADWPLEFADVRNVDWASWQGKAAVMTGGPPCQPFSIGGKQLGPDDPRDLWSEVVRAVRGVEPDVFVLENVDGLTGPKCRGYLEQVKASLRLLGYVVDHLIVNAADFGAPQNRKRVLIRGVRADLGVPLAPMLPTHSRDRLLWDQVVTGEYWARHGLKQPDDAAIPNADLARVRRLRRLDHVPDGLPWVTVRDDFAGLGEPDERRGHDSCPRVKTYKKHAVSVLDRPSRPLKAGVHGPGGGEGMVVLDDGTARCLTVRESARLAGMPDEFEFPVSRSQALSGLGNAVPVALGEAVGRWLMGILAAAGDERIN